jgi:hypothetical protein
MSYGFRYGLQPVLDHFAQRETLARAQFLSAGATLDCELAVLRALEGEPAGSIGSTMFPVRAGDLNEIELRSFRLETARREQSAQVATLRVFVQRQKDRFECAMGRRVQLERHRELRLEVHRAFQASLEEAELDESNALLPGPAASLCEMSSP